MQKGQTPVLILVGILIIMVVAGGVYFLGRSSTPRPLPTPVTTSPIPQPIMTASTTEASPAPTGAGETTSWKTYTVLDKSISFKYPNTYTLTGPTKDLQEGVEIKTGAIKLFFGYMILPEYETPPPKDTTFYFAKVPSNQTIENYIRSIRSNNLLKTEITKTSINNYDAVSVRYPVSQSYSGAAYVYIMLPDRRIYIASIYPLEKEDTFSTILSTFKFQ